VEFNGLNRSAPAVRSSSVFLCVHLWRSCVHLRRLPLAVMALTLVAATGTAQAPNAHWRTIRTPHFAVHFDAANEAIARRAAGSAERAYERLAPLLAPARGRIDLAVADNVDY
jgi:hypothetical protein